MLFYRKESLQGAELIPKVLLVQTNILAIMMTTVKKKLFKLHMLILNKVFAINYVLEFLHNFQNNIQNSKLSEEELFYSPI